MKPNKVSHLAALNFNAFFIAHTAHVLARGSNFHQDHALLGEVYEGLYEYHDVLAEQALISGEVYPFNGLADMDCSIELTGRNREITLLNVLTALETLETTVKPLFSSSETSPGLNTVLGDYAAAVAKLRWKVSRVLK